MVQAETFNATNASVTDAQGHTLGSEAIALTSAHGVSVVTTGNVDYSFQGSGNLVLSGATGTTLSATWDNFTATLTGTVSITLTTDALTLNGQVLPAGTYTITATLATLSGNGPTISTNFAGPVSINLSSGSVLLGPGSGNLTVAGTTVDPKNGSPLDGYSGSVTVAPGSGGGGDQVTLAGNAANVLSLSATSATLSTDQNTPVTFQAVLNTSLADTYNLTAQAPAGWTVAIDTSGHITVTPAPGLQAGTYPIQLLAQSASDPNLVAQTTIYVSVTPTKPAINFTITPDLSFTVPYNGAEVPTAYEVTLQNLGPTADTYSLSFANIPNGFTISSSLTRVTVPAGQSAIIGVYLIPSAGSTLPAPGTLLSFKITATSTTNPALTSTATESFNMPVVEAVTIASNPVQVESVPGFAGTATVTLVNAANVAASVALSFSTDTGLTLGGLGTAPVAIGIGQTVTETVSLTPAANVPLNSTLDATVIVGPAATQDQVSVLSVSPGPAFPVAGQSVDVTADIFAGVLNPRQADVSFSVLDGLGKTVFTSSPVAIDLGALPGSQTVDLGTFSTAGLSARQYTVQVNVDETGGQPIAGASNTGVIGINSPLAASLTLGSDTLDPTSANVIDSTLTLSNQTLLGGVQTNGTAASVAMVGALAYVVGTKDIAIVDVSNPADPQVVGTFGASDLNGGGLVQLAGNHLVVATSSANNANSFNLLIYSLANPRSPTLVSTTPIPYHFPAALVVQGNTAYVVTSGITYDSGGTIDDQYGDLLPIDISNPAAPTLASALFTDKGTPNGGAGNQHGLVPVSSTVAYLVGSTSTGSATQAGSGQVVIVNTANPASLTVAGTLSIPNTLDAQGIAVDGHYALVVGSTGGLLSPFVDPGQIHLTGNVTLTLLDISNPLQPAVVGTTLVTQFTFPSADQSPSGQVQVIDLGNGRFAISNLEFNGVPLILAVDTSGPANLLTSPVGVPANGLSAAGGNVNVANANGLQVLAANGLFDLTVTAQVVVPGGVTVLPSSFSIPPTQTTSGANSETLSWNLTLSPGEVQQIFWRSTVNGLQTGQVQQIVSGATVQFTGVAASGQFTLPAQSIGDVPETQSVDLPVQVVVPGVPAIASASVAAQQIGNTKLANQLNNLSVALTNLVQSPTNAIYLSQSQAALTSIISQVTADVFLAPFAAGLSAASTALANATSANDVDTAVVNLGTALDSLAQAITDEAAHGFTLGLANGLGIIQPGVPTTFNVLIQNTGSASTTYDFSVSGLPAGVTATFNQSSITLGPGQAVNGNNAITLSLSEPGATTLVPANFTVTATAEGATEITRGTTGQLTLRNESLQVAAVTTNPPFTQPGGPVDVTAKIESVVNEPRQVAVSYTVTDANGNVLFNSTPVTTTVQVTPTLTTVDLGTFGSTGFSDGIDTIKVTVADKSSQPLASATGKGSVTIGLPVTANLSVSPTTLPTGTGTVTNSLTINPAAAGNGVLSFLGQVTDNGTPTSVALDGTLAYVPTSTGIDIVDVSDPSTPTVVGTFGQKDVTQGGYDRARVVGNLLIVLSEQSGINANHFNFLVYSLTDPQNPQLVSNTPFNIAYIAGLAVNGTAAFIPSNVGHYSYGGGLFAQNGDFTAIDFSNNSAPTIGSNLSSTDTASPSISNTYEQDAVVVNSQVAYVTSSTSTGGPASGQTLTTGTGRLLVVNIQDPTKLSEETLPDGQAGGAVELDVPGTVYLYGIAIEDNYALVAGNSEGVDKDGNLPGNLTLTVVNISDPLNPQIVATVDTPNTFTSGAVKIQDLGNYQFAVTGTSLYGGPVLEIVNISDPAHPTYGAVQVPATLNGGITAAGGKLYLTSTTGLSIFNIGQLTLTPVTVSVEVPNGTGVSVVANSFNIPPTQTITGTNFTTLEWNLTLAATTTITWQSTVSNLAAGEVRAVTLGASVNFTSQGTTGTATVGGASVTGVPIISLTPESQPARPGGSVTYDVRLTNPTAAQITYYVLVQQNNDNFSQLLLNSGNPYVTVGAGQTVDVPLQITASQYAQAGDESFTVKATDPNSSNGASGSTPGDLVVAGSPVTPPQTNAYSVVATLTPATATAGQGTLAQFVVQLTNTGSVPDSYSLAISGLPSGVLVTLGNDDPILQPGVSNFLDVPLKLAVPTGTAPGSYSFTVTATSQSNNAVSTSANGTLTVSANGVSVSLTPSTGAPGSGFQMTVTNTGTITDTYNLSLGGPAALVATLGTTTVTLDAGQSQVVPITTTAVSFADAGQLPLIASATSQTDAAVVASATSDLTIPTSTGMIANFSPAVQTQQQVGPTTFLLLVNNTGNLQDSYMATITGTTGSLTASLVGLDGLPTQTVPVFILPGLSTGAIKLQTNSGQGTVTVQVTSLSNASITTTATATLNVQIPNSVATTTTVTSSLPNGSTYGQQVAFTATVSAASGTPTGHVQFQIDGANWGAAVTLQNGMASITTASLAAGSHKIVALYTSDSSNFNNSDNSATPLSQTVNPAPLTITANNQTVVQGGTLPALTATYNGLVNGDTPATFNVSPNVAPTLATVPTSSAPGSYPITVSGASDANYSITYVNGTLTITSAGPPSAVTISGEVFFDYNSNGVLDAADTGLAGRTIYIDLKNSGQLDSGDPFTTTAADGRYAFTGLAPGAYTVREQITYDNIALTSSTSQVVSATGNVTGVNFGNLLYNPAYPIYPTPGLYGSQPSADVTTVYVTGLYHAVLGRAPDLPGLAFWVNASHSGMPDAQVAYGFVNSLEHRQQEVDYYYEAFLGRARDPGSVVWIDDLLNGAGEAAVVEGILTSPEYTTKHASDTAFVTELYFQLLGRQADNAGAASWEQDLANGASRAEVVAGFLFSQESAELASESLYAAFLHRAKDQGGDNHWTSELVSKALTFGQVAADYLWVSPHEFMANASKAVAGT